jgi:uncharacterized protein YegL
MLRFIAGVEKGARENVVRGWVESVVCFVDDNELNLAKFARWALSISISRRSRK